MSKVYMMVTITNRNKRKDFRTFFKEQGLPVFLETTGRGTAQSEVLDYFGLEESEKLLFLAIVTGETWKKLRRGLITKMLIDVPGTGVSFIVPLSSVGGRKTLQFLVNEQEFEKEEETSMKDTDYELLVAIANQGYIDTVMDAARSAKAGGGTVIHAKGTGMELAKKYLGVSLVEEKEVILIVTKSREKNQIMKAIMEQAGLDSKEHNIGTGSAGAGRAGTFGIKYDTDSGGCRGSRNFSGGRCIAYVIFKTAVLYAVDLLSGGVHPDFFCIKGFSGDCI